MSEYGGEKFDVSISLDVIFHLVDQAVFDNYMNNLFSASKKIVVIYSSNLELEAPAPHVKHRKFDDWINKNKQEWHLESLLPNKYPFEDDLNSQSMSDFYVYKKNS